MSSHSGHSREHPTQLRYPSERGQSNEATSKTVVICNPSIYIYFEHLFLM